MTPESLREVQDHRLSVTSMHVEVARRATAAGVLRIEGISESERLARLGHVSLDLLNSYQQSAKITGKLPETATGS